eukprot:CAMPEP_0119359404 /NCGR_PEP_ID=MMETSP1334-20130426/7304_1 /TAXON_ID=127549 /ORGANISM="Calcidiscus leptoporus, Strain RCC1130" /LENGTH=56 /DNA_ID=CAMNT_0007374071 /DNA_START=422 /DNA_END=589 /DNA_ORIENTATION=+
MHRYARHHGRTCWPRRIRCSEAVRVGAWAFATPAKPDADALRLRGGPPALALRNDG